MLSILFCLYLAPAAASQKPQAPVALSELLLQLGQREGFEVVFLGPAPQQAVSLPAAGLTLRETVVSLLEGAGLNYAISGKGPTLVRVLVGVPERSSLSATSQASTPTAGPAAKQPDEKRTVNPDPNDPEDPLNDPKRKIEQHPREIDPDDPDEAGLDLAIPALPPQIDMNDPDEKAREQKRDPNQPVVRLPPQIDMNDPDEARRHPELLKPQPSAVSKTGGEAESAKEPRTKSKRP